MMTAQQEKKLEEIMISFDKRVAEILRQEIDSAISFHEVATGKPPSEKIVGALKTGVAISNRINRQAVKGEIVSLILENKNPGKI
jgi:anaerobic ribonucleoside-triphosphate reductase